MKKLKKVLLGFLIFAVSGFCFVYFAPVVKQTVIYPPPKIQKKLKRMKKQEGWGEGSINLVIWPPSQGEKKEIRMTLWDYWHHYYPVGVYPPEETFNPTDPSTYFPFD